MLTFTVYSIIFVWMVAIVNHLARRRIIRDRMNAYAAKVMRP